ncbi:hypothetical protein NIES37_23630 [Tolypothrix tenuis PCC 7101]|uniref:Uncharacterized protein n=1 Tax=Tolypothrix tenuis PCC 7101 TaxID=231146 RepID=A0A1Z4MY94_9CYAN|nr:hypothetical protein NIES37_23630 [Tolypothrix tenuis PCC 7101]BAZ77668.1 hypothetical protein NIES50_62990 [Aulosira laxa NIES-50]
MWFSLYHFEKRTRQMSRGTAPVRYLICQKIEDAVPLQRIYLSQTLFELVLPFFTNGIKWHEQMNFIIYPNG